MTLEEVKALAHAIAVANNHPDPTLYANDVEFAFNSAPAADPVLTFPTI